jgi:fido (protein-threonine AMPylation protein)
MELHVLDPFGDFETAGYLRNLYKEKDLRVLMHLEKAAFREHVHATLRFLRRVADIRYEHVLEAHRRLFDSVYPWAGQDRLENAPRLRIVKAGHRELFALPDSIRIAAEYALQLSRGKAYLRGEECCGWVGCELSAGVMRLRVAGELSVSMALGFEWVSRHGRVSCLLELSLPCSGNN